MSTLLPSRSRRVAAAAGLTVLLAACGTSGATSDTTTSTDDTTTTATETETPSTAASTTTGTSDDVPGPGEADATVDANTASVGEIADALDAAGVDNADRWAREVEEYRPYPTDDPDLTRLQQNLAKYNPGDETLARILSALTV